MEIFVLAGRYLIMRLTCPDNLISKYPARLTLLLSLTAPHIAARIILNTSSLASRASQFS